jgi:NitT/TauT family transport system substrate-binding protein
MRKSVISVVILAFAIIAGITIWSYYPSSHTVNPVGNSTELRRITIAQFGDFFLYAPLYIAADGGLFRKEGLDVSIVNTGGDDKTWAAVLSGSAAFGVADPTFVAVSAARGQHGVVIASLVNGVPFWGITYQKKIAPFNESKELGTYKVATFPSPSTAYSLQKKMYSDAGLEPNIREGGFGAIIPMLKAGDADIGLELEPNVSLAVKEGASIVYSLAKQYGDFAITGVTASDLTVQRDAALVHKVVASLQGALDMLHNNPEEALKLLSKRFPGLPQDVASEALHRVIRDGVIPKSTMISEVAWDKAIKLRVDIGDLKSAAPYKEFVWNDQANKK